jgi:hypothetical protein
VIINTTIRVRNAKGTILIQPKVGSTPLHKLTRQHPDKTIAVGIEIAVKQQLENTIFSPLFIKIQISHFF